MRTGRLEAFSDGVLAIIITIMVLGLQVPDEPTWSALSRVGSDVLTYLLSFIYVGIYWNNHHHMFQLVRRVTGGVLWSNLGLLFWLSLLPFTTAWMDRTRFEPLPVVTYGANLLACAVAYFVLQSVIVRTEGPPHALRTALGRDLKAKSSPVLYVAGMLATLVSSWLAMAVYTFVAAMWLVPDRRAERYVEEHGTPDD